MYTCKDVPISTLAMKKNVYARMNKRNVAHSPKLAKLQNVNELDTSTRDILKGMSNEHSKMQNS